MPWPDFGRGSGDRANYCKHFERRLRSVLLSGKVDDMIQFSVKLLGKHLCMFVFSWHNSYRKRKVRLARPTQWNVVGRAKASASVATAACFSHSVLWDSCCSGARELSRVEGFDGIYGMLKKTKHGQVETVRTVRWLISNSPFKFNLQVSVKVQYYTHICFAIICYQWLAWLGKSIAAWNPAKDVNLRVFTAQVIVPALCNEGAWGIRCRDWSGWETNKRVEQHLIQKEAWKEISVSETFRVEQGTLTLVGTSCETVCMPSWPMEPTAMRPRTQTFAYTNWFASQAKPHKWYRVHFMKGSCFNSMSHEDMFSTVRPFCLHLFAPAIILGFVFGFWSWNHLKLPRATTERSFFLMWPLKDNSANMETPKFKSPLDLSFSHGLSFLNFLWFIDFPTVRSPKSFIFKLAVNPGEPGHQEVGPGPIGPGQTSPGLCSAGPDLGYSWRPSWRHATSNRHLVQQWICWSNSIKFCLPICWPTDWGPSDHGSVFSVGCPMYTPKIAKAHHGDMTFGNSQCYPHWVVMLFVTQRDNEDIIESGWPGTQNWFTPQSTIDPTHRPRRKHHQ